MNTIGLPALTTTYENYIWCLYNDSQAWVIDPGEAQPVLDFLDTHNLELKALLITHQHPDHINGVNALKQAYSDCTVYGPCEAKTELIEQTCEDGDRLQLNKHLFFNVIATPGHTSDHIAFYNDTSLFCGDTLFSAGCGRILGGTYAQFTDSILKLRALPDHLNFYSAHEYTQTNLTFAKLVEPNNAALLARIANTVIEYPENLSKPQSSLAEEKATNPFLRFDKEPLKEALIQRAGLKPEEINPTQLFKALRDWKDDFDRQH